MDNLQPEERVVQYTPPLQQAVLLQHVGRGAVGTGYALAKHHDLAGRRFD